VDREDIIRMAREAGAPQAVSPRNPDRPAHSFSMKHLECFANLVAAHEREQILDLECPLGWVKVDDIRARGGK